MASILLFASIFLTLLFTFTNGMKDGCNVAATTIASRSISRRSSLLIVCVSEFSGPFLFGIPVALTIAKGILHTELLSQGVQSLMMLFCGILGALVWNILTWVFRMPTSSSFALVGGLIGPALYNFGSDAVPWKLFLLKVVGALFLSPLLGIAFGFLVFRVMALLLRDAHFNINGVIKKIQVVSLAILGLSHGSNDAQKTMGTIALLLYFSGKTEGIAVDPWVKLASIGALTTGIALGGTKIIKTVGYDIFRLRPIHSLASHIASAIILLVSNVVGTPVSTTQIISSSVMGVGSAFRRKSIRWSLIFTILWSWILTIPLTASIAVLFTIIMGKFLI
jgi:PiT family inorganic phosphate transporter